MSGGLNTSKQNKPLVLAITLEIIAFPVWWYTRGLVSFLNLIKNNLVFAWHYTAVGVWIKNLFVPMYGDNSLAGRLISFGLRTFMIFVRGFGLVLWIILLGLFFVGYISILPLGLWLIVINLGSLYGR